MDKVIIEKLSNRENFLKDHNDKYLALEALLPNRVGKLREIVESLPNGERKALATEIIDWVHSVCQEVLKDWHGLQEGSKLRNALDDAVQSLRYEDHYAECMEYIQLSQRLTKKLMEYEKKIKDLQDDLSRRSTN
jgi:hypothetical protein